MIVVKVVFWFALGALVWTHVGYPAATAIAARLRKRRPAVGDELPTVAVVVAAYNEESVIARRLDNLLELDYPREQLDIVVASDASID